MLYSHQAMRDAPLWNKTRRKYLLAALGVSVLVFVVFAHTSHAEIFQDAENIILDTLISILQRLIAFMLDVTLFFITFLVSAAQYSNFVNAYPVQIGWVLVRDVVNMFFIVVLLVMAFSTVIGYDEFSVTGSHSKLPKLLMMAVLVNFSRTLVGLLIDFSQVITLTFVNGFRAAAAGNFINMFKLNDVVNLSNTSGPITSAAIAAAKGPTLENLFYSCLLGVIMLLIAMSVIAMLTVYMVVRIIGLWILLIFSPIAFFALALPEKMKKGLGSFTDDWWKKLSSLLAGGPIVAFFLWLALATAQGGGNAPPQPGCTGTNSGGAFAQVYTCDASAADQKAAGVGITSAGDPEKLGGFFVAILMLLMALDQALSSTKSVSSQAVPLAAAVGGFALGAARGIARRTASATVGLAGAAVGKIDSKSGFTAVVAKRANLASAALSKRAAQGGLGGFVAGLGAGVTQGVGNSASRVVGARKDAYKKAAEEKVKGLSVENSIRTHEAAAASPMASDTEKEVHAAKARDLRLTRAGQEVVKGDLKREFETKNPKSPEFEAIEYDGKDKAKLEEQRQAKITHGADYKEYIKNQKDFIEGRNKQVSADIMEKSKEYARKSGDIETLGKLEDEQDKDPSKGNDIKEMHERFAKLDPEVIRKTVKPVADKDGMANIALWKAMGWIKNGKRLSDKELETNDAYQDMIKAPAWKKNLEGQARVMDTAMGQRHMADALKVLDGDDSEDAKTAMLKSRYFITPSGAAVNIAAGAQVQARPVQTYAKASAAVDPAARATFELAFPDATKRETMASKLEMPMTDVQAESMTTNAAVIYGSSGVTIPEAAAGMQDMQSKGIPVTITAGFDRTSGKFRDASSESAYRTAIQDSFKDIAANKTYGDTTSTAKQMDFIANIDPADLKTENEVSVAVVAELHDNIETLNDAFAVDQVDPDQAANIEQLMGTVYKQAEKLRATAKDPAHTTPFTAHENKILDLMTKLEDKTNSAIHKVARAGAKQA